MELVGGVGKSGILARKSIIPTFIEEREDCLVDKIAVPL